MAAPCAPLLPLQCLRPSLWRRSYCALSLPLRLAAAIIVATPCAPLLPLYFPLGPSDRCDVLRTSPPRLAAAIIAATLARRLRRCLWLRPLSCARRLRRCHGCGHHCGDDRIAHRLCRCAWLRPLLWRRLAYRFRRCPLGCGHHSCDVLRTLPPRLAAAIIAATLARRLRRCLRLRPLLRRRCARRLCRCFRLRPALRRRLARRLRCCVWLRLHWCDVLRTVFAAAFSCGHLCGDALRTAFAAASAAAMIAATPGAMRYAFTARCCFMVSSQRRVARRVRRRVGRGQCRDMCLHGAFAAVLGCGRRLRPSSPHAR